MPKPRGCKRVRFGYAFRGPTKSQSSAARLTNQKGLDSEDCLYKTKPCSFEPTFVLPRPNRTLRVPAAPSMHLRLSKACGSRVDMSKTRAGLNYIAPSYFACSQTASRATYCWSSRSIGYLVSRPRTGPSFAPRSMPSRSGSSRSISRPLGALRPMPTNSPGACSRPSTA